MKVWEKIVTNFRDTKGQTREQIKARMYNYRMTPCLENERYGWLTDKQMEEVCNDVDCDNCLDRYLDAEITKGEGTSET